MLQKMFVIYDSKTEAYLTPFFMPSKGDAIRALSSLVADVSHNFGKYPEDFTLFEIGSWNNSDCKFVLHEAKHSIGVLVEFKRESSIAK